jgi:predicted nucleic acid-binding protein
MVLVDTSVWVDHLRAGDAALTRLLGRNEALLHPFIVAELALGNLRQRELILGSLAALPQAIVATDVELMALVETAPLHGLGIGFVDAHLIASVRLMPGTRIWTRDKRLLGAAQVVGLGFVAEGAV